MTDLIDDQAQQLAILRKLYLIRDIEEAIAARYAEGKMRCPTHLSIGQEGAPTALSAQLSSQDYAVSTHRAHAHYLAKGGCPKAMIAEIYGKATGCSGGRGGSMHLIDERVGFKGSTAIVGNTIPIGVGLALSQKLRKEPNVSVVFVGDGAIEEGVFYEAANFAAVQKLPVLFVCENNLYSVYSDLTKRQPQGRQINQMVKGLGLTAYSGDGNDTVASYALFEKVIKDIKQGQGPVFVELSTYRWREHCGPNYDNQLGYRSEEEFLAWQQLEPIARFEHWLLNNQLMSQETLKIHRQKADLKVEQAFNFAERSAFPEINKMAEHVYAGGIVHA